MIIGGTGDGGSRRGDYTGRVSHENVAGGDYWVVGELCIAPHNNDARSKYITRVDRSSSSLLRNW